MTRGVAESADKLSYGLAYAMPAGYPAVLRRSSEHPQQHPAREKGTRIDAKRVYRLEVVGEIPTNQNRHHGGNNAQAADHAVGPDKLMGAYQRG